MATLEYDITHYQPILFAVDGMGELTDRVGGFFAEFDDDTPARLAAAARAAGRARRGRYGHRRASLLQGVQARSHCALYLLHDAVDVGRGDQRLLVPDPRHAGRQRR